MDTPAAALIRRTDTPSCPCCLRQLSVASTRASRRTWGVARRNLGTVRLAAMHVPSASMPFISCPIRRGPLRNSHRKVARVRCAVPDRFELSCVSMAAVNGVHDCPGSETVPDTGHGRNTGRVEIGRARRERTIQIVVGLADADQHQRFAGDARLDSRVYIRDGDRVAVESGYPLEG